MQHYYITIIVNVCDCPTSIASKKEGNIFYHVYKRFVFYFGDKKTRFLRFLLHLCYKL